MIERVIAVAHTRRTRAGVLYTPWLDELARRFSVKHEIDMSTAPASIRRINSCTLMQIHAGVGVGCTRVIVCSVEMVCVRYGDAD